MNILVFAKLGERNLFYHLLPLLNNEKINKIVVVRSLPGYFHPKMIYLCPKKKGNVVGDALRKILLAIDYLSRQKDIDYVHSYLLYPHGFFALIIGFLFKIPVGVSLIAGPVEVFDPGKSPIWKFRYDCDLNMPTSVVAKIVIMYLSKFTAITTTGSYTTNFLIKNCGLDENKIFNLPHVTDYILYLEANKSEKYYDIGTIARLAPVKHIEVFIEIVEALKLYNPNIKAVVVGDGPEHAKLIKQTIESGLQDNIDFVGYQQDIWKWLDKMRLFILTSEREGFPYSIIESMTAGVPVICSKCGDVIDIVLHEETGLLVDRFNDVNGYVYHIRALLKDDAAREMMAINSKRRIENMMISDNAPSLIWQKLLDSI